MSVMIPAYWIPITVCIMLAILIATHSDDWFLIEGESFVAWMGCSFVVWLLYFAIMYFVLINHPHQ